MHHFQTWIWHVGKVFKDTRLYSFHHSKGNFSFSPHSQRKPFKGEREASSEKTWAKELNDSSSTGERLWILLIYVGYWMSDWVNWPWKWKQVCPLLLFKSCEMGILTRGKHAAEEHSPSATAWSSCHVGHLREDRWMAACRLHFTLVFQIYQVSSNQ